MADLKALVKKAIENEDFSIIEAIKDKNQLRYIQKYAELFVSNINSKISFLSLYMELKGSNLCIIAIGISLFLVGVSINNITKISYLLTGVVIIGLGVWMEIRINKYKKEIEKIEKDIEFMQDFVLKIEEKLLK